MAEKPEEINQDEQDLKEYLAGDSDLSKAYRTEEKEQVPVHLDKVILSAANEAFKPKQLSKVAYSPFARSWYVPASMAAVLMLCVGLVFTIYQDSGQTLLTVPKSEYDIDVQIEPMESVEKSRQVEMMDTISEANKPVPASSDVDEAEEAITKERPASKMLLREETSGMDDAFQSELRGKGSFKRDAAKQTMSDSPYLPERRDVSGRLETADVKKQKQVDENILNNKLGDMESKVNEKDTDIGVSTDRVLRYRKAEENYLEQDKVLKKEVLDGDMTVEGLASPALSVGNEVMTPEQWLVQINDLWVSGEHEEAKESLNQFFMTYPDYSIEKMKTILDPDSGLMDHIK